MTRRLIGRKMSETTAEERQELADYVDKTEIPPEFEQGMIRLETKYGEAVFMIAMFVTDMAHVTNCISSFKSPVPGHVKGVLKSASHCTIWATQQLAEALEVDPASIIEATLEMTELKNVVSAMMATEFDIHRGDHDEAKDVLKKAAS